MDSTADAPVSRRRALLLGGALAGGALGVAACSSSSDTSSSTPQSDASTTTTSAAASDGPAGGTDEGTGTPSATVFTAADFAALGTCVVLPELTEGPFPTRSEIERRDVTEGIEGMPLRVGIQVVDESCAPVPGATVEIWHCDVDGDYSEYLDGATDDDAGPEASFLRGSQVSNDEGIVEFHTIWPGWYSGRAIHIHSKIHVDDSTVLTTQYLFDDALNEEVMATGPYKAHGPPDTTNGEDGVTRGSGSDDLLFSVADDSDIGGRRALIVVGVDPEASSRAGSGGGPSGSARR